MDKHNWGGGGIFNLSYNELVSPYMLYTLSSRPLRVLMLCSLLLLYDLHSFCTLALVRPAILYLMYALHSLCLHSSTLVRSALFYPSTLCTLLPLYSLHSLCTLLSIYVLHSSTLVCTTVALHSSTLVCSSLFYPCTFCPLLTLNILHSSWMLCTTCRQRLITASLACSAVL